MDVDSALRYFVLSDLRLRGGFHWFTLTNELSLPPEFGYGRRPLLARWVQSTPETNNIQSLQLWRHSAATSQDGCFSHKLWLPARELGSLQRRILAGGRSSLCLHLSADQLIIRSPPIHSAVITFSTMLEAAANVHLFRAAQRTVHQQQVNDDLNLHRRRLRSAVRDNFIVPPTKTDRYWAFTRSDRRTDRSVRPRLRPTVCQTSRTDRLDRL